MPSTRSQGSTIKGLLQYLTSGNGKRRKLPGIVMHLPFSKENTKESFGEGKMLTRGLAQAVAPWQLDPLPAVHP